MLTYLLPSHFLLSLLSCFWFLTHFCVLLLPYTYIVTIVMWRASSPKFALWACVQKKFSAQVHFCNKMTSRQNAPTKNKHKSVNIGIDFILFFLPLSYSSFKQGSFLTGVYHNCMCLFSFVIIHLLTCFIVYVMLSKGYKGHFLHQYPCSHTAGCFTDMCQGPMFFSFKVSC